MCREDSSTPMLVDPSQETPPRTWCRQNECPRWYGASWIPETPPRAWGRPFITKPLLLDEGNTPTCVGKTPGRRTRAPAARKHPHVRGEDACFHSFWRSPSETPPRAWGRPSTPTQTDLACRNTPTCVGKTYRLFHQQLAIQKHPHVRGEDDNPFPRVILNRETPPRAWGRPARQALLSSTRRNTPTCVGKTSAALIFRKKRQKHPHVRGEDASAAK